MIETLNALAGTLSAQTLTVDEMVDQLSGRAVDMTGSVVVEEPGIAGVDRASVVREVHGDEPVLVTLELSEALAEDYLEAAFGTPARVHPEHPGDPESLVYRLELPERPYAVALIAGAGAGGVKTLTLRRDIRLPG